ncbi:MAG: transaldolase [Acidobacteria bacterium]|nr:MAG: transaldolase [Acidobacteriota bacterium]
MVSTTPTDYWNDSCSLDELAYGLQHGAVGATTNPVIVLTVLKKSISQWQDRLHQMIVNSTWSENEITWRLVEEMAVKGAELLLPVFEHHKGRKGRLSIQTNPVYYRDTEALVEQAVHFASLALNMQVKLPVTAAGIPAIEEVTFRGVSVNATVSFTVSQAIAVAEAVERGLRRREAAGLDIEQMSPVATIMIGRTDDWMQVVAKRDNIDVDPSYLSWPGIATFKRAYGIFQERGYRARLLVAAYRHLGHWSELIGGNFIHSMPCDWARKANASELPIENSIDRPVREEIVEELYRKFPDFKRAYEPDGMTIAEFDGFGATVRTLRGFIEAVHELTGVVRDFMLPNPDVKH